jgi:hypothetical protein
MAVGVCASFADSDRGIDPFKIFDNVWYVGIQTSSPYLVTTSAGHLLFDATWDETAD